MNKLTLNISRVVILVVLLVLWAGDLAAETNYRIDSSVYVFKHTDFQSIKLPADKIGDHGTVMFRSPATVEFDQEKLSLSGAQLLWSSGRNPPDRFTLTKIPEMITGPGKPVEVLSTAPVQYIEKEADGTLQVRNISRDSTDAPHCRIRFAVASRGEATRDQRVSCQLDIVTVSSRTPVPGVSLEVGRPVLTHFRDQVEMVVRLGEWAALLLQAPNRSDYSLLLLLKTTQKPAAESGVGQASSFMTIKDLDDFATYYYLSPQPERIGRAIASLGPSGFLDTAGRTYPFQFRQRAYTCIGFFAEVFANNPERVVQWRNLIEQSDGESRYWLRKALKLSASEGIRGFKSDDPSGIDEINVLWGAFFASGNSDYLRKLIGQLELVDDTGGEHFDLGAEDMLLFASNAPRHAAVRQALDTSRHEVNSRTHELIDDLLNKDLAGILEELRNMDRSSSYSNLGDSRNALPWRRPLSTSR